MIQTHYDRAQNLVVHNAEERVALDDFMAALTYWYEHDDFDPSVPVMWDLRDAMVDVSFSELSVLGPLFEFVNDHRTSGKTAWVVPNELGGAVLKALYEERDWLTEWGTFSDPADAVDWLLS